VRHPCDVCRRVHRGRCKPADKRSVSVTITIPTHLHRELAAKVPWGERSRWITRLIRQELEA